MYREIDVTHILAFIQICNHINISFSVFDIKDLALYGLSINATNVEKYMVLAFECGLAL